MKKMVSEWILCPVCGNKTRLQIREDTELKNFPLYCPKCKQESLIEAKDLQVTVVKRLEVKTQVSYEVYAQFCRFVKCERNLRRSDERHLEQSELTEETLCRRALHKPKSVDEAVNDKIRTEQLDRAIMELPEAQQRRFRLYFDYGLTYEQIGKIEGCSKVAVKYTIDKAVIAVKKKLKDFD